MPFSRSYSASASRRRRIIAIQSAREALESSQLRTLAQQEFESATLSSEPELTSLDPAFRKIRSYLRGSQPRTWLFLGDCLGFAPQIVRRSYIEYFSDMLRSRLNRAADAVVDITVVDSSALKVRDQMVARLKRFRPDIAFFMPGLQDVATGDAGRESFERALREMALRTAEQECLLVIATPPLLLATEHEEFSDLPAYVDIVRQVSHDQGLLLVDHWKYWELARECRQVDEWVDITGKRLLHEGHRRASQLLCRTLGILTTNKRSPK